MTKKLAANRLFKSENFIKIILKYFYLVYFLFNYYLIFKYQLNFIVY